MELLIIATLIMTSILISITHIFQNKAVSDLGSFSAGIIGRFVSVLFLGLISLALYLYDKPFGPLYMSKSFDLKSVMFTAFNGICLLFISLFVGFAFYYNKNLKKPLNVGILTAILTSAFVFTLIINDLINYFTNKPLNFSFMHLLGITILLIGIFIISL